MTFHLAPTIFAGDELREGEDDDVQPAKRRRNLHRSNSPLYRRQDPKERLEKDGAGPSSVFGRRAGGRDSHWLIVIVEDFTNSGRQSYPIQRILEQ